METERTSGVAVNHVAVGFACTGASLACVLGLKGQPLIWIVMPKSKKVRNSKANTCQYNFHSILKRYLCHSLLSDVPYPVTTLFPFLQYSLSNTASSFDVLLSRHRTCWGTNHEIYAVFYILCLVEYFWQFFQKVFHSWPIQFWEKNRK